MVLFAVWLSQFAAGARWTFSTVYGTKRLMAPAVVALVACLLFACAHAAAWLLPAYAGLLAWNGRNWLAFGGRTSLPCALRLERGQGPKMNLAGNRATKRHRDTRKSPTGTSLKNGLRSAGRSLRRSADVMNSRSRARVMPT